MDCCRVPPGATRAIANTPRRTSGWLTFIRRAKELGFSLADIAELLSLSANRHDDMRGVKRKAEEHLEQVELKIRELQRVRRGLNKLIAACPGHGELETCPIVAALAEPGKREGRGG